MKMSHHFTFIKFWQDGGDFSLYLIPSLMYVREKMPSTVWNTIEINFLSMSYRIELERDLSPKS